MNGCNIPTVDLEGATDQLVDEICERLTALYALVDITLAEDGPPVEAIREHAADVVRRLTSPQSHAVADDISRTLWPPPEARPPAPWRDTPLGELVAEALAPLPAPGRRA